MIKFENTSVVGITHAIRGMRNPMNSWDKSDSGYCEGRGPRCETCPYNPGEYEPCYFANMYRGKLFVIGEKDLDLIERLRNAGADHRKILRFVDVYVDITAPLYWWKEFKTYRRDRKFQDEEDFYDTDDYDNEMFIEMNSCSTMHKLTAKEFTLADFSHDYLIDDENIPTRDYSPMEMLKITIDNLNKLRDLYIKTKDIKYWYQIVQLLPSSYNQKRTVKMSFEVLYRMRISRDPHKLKEWRDFCEWIDSLEYSEIIIGK